MDVHEVLGTAEGSSSVTEAKKPASNAAEKSAPAVYPRTKVRIPMEPRPRSLHSDPPAVLGDRESRSIGQATGDSKGMVHAGTGIPFHHSLPVEHTHWKGGLSYRAPAQSQQGRVP